MPPPRTKPGTRKLSDVARHVIAPSGIVSTGYPAVRDKCREIGIVHDDWQQGLGRLALGKRADGKYAATVGGIVLSIPRQVGKTYFVGSLIFALCLLFPGLTVIWTAHHTRTSDETFGKMSGIARRAKVRPYIETVRRANGQQTIEFRNESRVLFGAREQGFGRGFAEVDIEVFDEAQILSERALEDMVAATNQAKHIAGALLFYMGTPPRPIDPGEAFTNKRAKAISGKSTDMVYLELSADKGSDPDDREQWAKANLSYPARTPLESMLRLRENVGSDESWMREGLGVWDDELLGLSINPEMWQTLADPDPKNAPGKITTFAVEVDMDRSRSSVGAAGLRGDGRMHLELVHPDLARCKELSIPWPLVGTRWVVPWCMHLAKTNRGAAFVIDGGGPAAVLIEPLEAAGLTVITVNTGDVAQASAGLVDAVRDGLVAPAPQPQLLAAVRGAKKRVFRDGGFTFSRVKSDVDVTPLIAVMLARWYALIRKPPKSRVINLNDVMREQAARAEQDVVGVGDS